MRLAINPHIMNVKESATLAINQHVQKMRANGEQVFHFGFGQSPFPVPQEIQSALSKNSDKKSYLPTRGLPALLDAVAKFHQEQCNNDVSANQVVIGPGSKELIFQAIYLLEGPLLIPAPSWVSYGPQAAIRGKQIVPMQTKRDNGYRLQASELDAACHSAGEGQKILILNNPNNPTGSSHSNEELRALAAICRAYGVIVISDEIYGLVNFSGHKHRSIAHYYPEGSIITGGLSKAFSAGGYRLGTMIIPKEMQALMDALMSLISETFSAVSAPIQYAALAAYEYSDAVKEEVELCTEIHKFTGEYLHQRFTSMGLNCPKPAGAFYLFPDFDHYREQLKKQNIITSNQLLKRILDEAKVAMLPASDFYLPATHLGARVASVDYDGHQVLKDFPGENDIDEDRLNTLFPNLVAGCDALEAWLKKL